MTKDQVENFLRLQPLIESSYKEISLLSKKNPTEQMNKFKLKFINNLLKQANELLGDSYQPFSKEFELFDEEDLPNYSDVVFMLSHYLTSLKKQKKENINRKSDFSTTYYWVINNKISDIEA